MIAWALAALGVQAALMFVDEFHFHRRRGLPRWERVGHPLDTASVLVCYGFALALAPTTDALVLYAFLALGSCLLVTKDEKVHHEQCTVAEQRLHAWLFLLHPVVLAAAALLWFEGARRLLALQAGLTCFFGLYQLAYWNLPWSRSRAR